MRLRLIVDLIYIALDAIWSNKLRSFLTILGNLVAVASIITLVSLIQGVNDEVKNAILSEVGADAFMIARRGVVTSEEEIERTRNNPRITLCLLYTSAAADDLLCVDLGGRRIIKK